MMADPAFAWWLTLWLDGRALCDAPLPCTRFYWRRACGFSPRVAADPRPLREITLRRPLAPAGAAP